MPKLLPPTPTVMTTIDRVIAAFPSDVQEVTRARLAGALQAIVAQRLLPRADGEGRCVAAEVLVATDAVREALRTAKGAKGIPNLMAEDEEHGMVTLQQNVADLLSAGLISDDTAQAVGTS